MVIAQPKTDMKTRIKKGIGYALFILGLITILYLGC